MSLIPESTIILHEEMAEQFITDLGRDCELIYAPIRSKCPNCENGHTYNGTGPISFTNGSVCPYCSGADYIETETRETVRLMVYYDPKNWVNVKNMEVLVPGEIVQVRGLMSIYPKLERANRMIITLDNKGLGEALYTKNGPPIPFGVRLKTEFIQMWRRLS